MSTPPHQPAPPQATPAHIDLEAQAKPVHEENQAARHASPAIFSSATDQDADEATELQDNSRVPRWGLLKLFWFFFYNFGLFAWGGPVAQIALIKQRLVVEDQWISLRRFQKVFSVYQILPGPEAAELCMFFGCLSAGRAGGIVAGLAFMLPGFGLMLLASYIYVLVGLRNEHVGASFRALQPVVAALVRRPCFQVPPHRAFRKRV